MKSQYPEVITAIKDWIANQKLQPGARLPSSLELSELLGFSRTTTQIACNVLIAGGIIRRDGYKLVLSNQSPLRSPIEGVVQIVSYCDSFIKTAGRILTQRGVKHRGVQLNSTKHKNPLPALRKVFAENPAGVIFWMPTWNHSLKSILESEKIPMVICADGIPPEVNLHTIGVDFYRGIEKGLKHLMDLGHRQIAYVTDFPFNPQDEHYNCYRKICLQLELKQTPATFWEMDSRLEEDMSETLLHLHQRHPEITALFIATGPVANLAMRTFQIPKKLSLVSWGSATVKNGTTITILDRDENLALSACTNLITQIQLLDSGLPPRPPCHIFLMPDLVDHGSTRALIRKELRPKAPEIKTAPENSWNSWQKTYPFCLKNSSSRWLKIDLTRVANHSMTREHGWLGDEPLLHFPSGLQTIHGVPFQVIDETRNAGRAVLTFRSPHTHTANKTKLPIKASLPVGKCVKALYFLHGCGFASPTPFAEYIMHFKNGKTETVQLIPMGPSPKLALKRLGNLKPNLQDWWLDHNQHDFPNAMHATVSDPASPQEYERTLYTLEWINPRPKDEISLIEVKVAPKAGPALALIAATALL